MSKITLITGGARSGKSTYAENYFDSNDRVLYIATSIAFDDEMKARVEKHKICRPNTWLTLETYKNITESLARYNNMYDNILLDCITLMVTNNLLDAIGVDGEKIDTIDEEDLERKIKEDLHKLIEYVIVRNITLVMVTNEVGSGIVPENKLSRIFRDMAGRINAYLAGLSDEVYMVVCGIPMRVK